MRFRWKFFKGGGESSTSLGTAASNADTTSSPQDSRRIASPLHRPSTPSHPSPSPSQAAREQTTKRHNRGALPFRNTPKRSNTSSHAVTPTPSRPPALMSQRTEGIRSTQPEGDLLLPDAHTQRNSPKLQRPDLQERIANSSPRHHFNVPQRFRTSASSPASPGSANALQRPSPAKHEVESTLPVPPADPIPAALGPLGPTRQTRQPSSPRTISRNSSPTSQAGREDYCVCGPPSAAEPTSAPPPPVEPTSVRPPTPATSAPPPPPPPPPPLMEADDTTSPSRQRDSPMRSYLLRYPPHSTSPVESPSGQPATVVSPVSPFRLSGVLQGEVTQGINRLRQIVARPPSPFQQNQRSSSAAASSLNRPPPPPSTHTPSKAQRVVKCSSLSPYEQLATAPASILFGGGGDANNPKEVVHLRKTALDLEKALSRQTAERERTEAQLKAALESRSEVFDRMMASMVSKDTMIAHELEEQKQREDYWQSACKALHERVAELTSRNEDIERELQSKISSSACVICLEDEARCITFPCCHMCLCTTCCRLVRQCPVCRRDIAERYQVYTG